MSFELVEETESVIALLRNFAEEVPAEAQDRHRIFRLRTERKQLKINSTLRSHQ